MAVKRPPPYLERNLQKPYRLAQNNQFVLKWAYDPIIYPLDTDYVVINMEQHETTEQKPARTYESFSEETKWSLRTINMGIGGRYQIVENKVEYWDQWSGTWHFLRYLTTEEIALREYLNRDVEQISLAPCGCETRSRTDLSVGWHRCGMEDE